ncbi:MAG: 2-dehydro-3-deoxy-6-phosphogalactonate aldolase [Amphiplicatus sp.]
MPNSSGLFDTAFDACPIVAIIRGVTPGEAASVGRALYDAGIRIIEVPMNSPEPLKSIEVLSSALGEKAVIGAGTVLTVEEAEAVASAGGRLCVSPNTDPAVIKATRSLNLVSIPGVFSPTEAFAALAAGADLLKLFPASSAGRDVFRNMKAVLPPGTRVIAVGGVTFENAGECLAEGFAGVGAGAELYKPRRTIEEIYASAKRLVSSLMLREER